MDIRLSRRGFLRGAGALVASPVLRSLPLVGNLAAVTAPVLGTESTSDDAVWEAVEGMLDGFNRMVHVGDSVETMLEGALRHGRLKDASDISYAVSEFAQQTAHLEFMALFPDHVLQTHYTRLVKFLTNTDEKDEPVDTDSVLQGHAIFDAIRSQANLRRYIEKSRTQLEDALSSVRLAPASYRIEARDYLYKLNFKGWGHLFMPYDFRKDSDWGDPLNINLAIEQRFLDEFTVRLKRYTLAPDMDALMARYEQSQYFRWMQTDSVMDVYKSLMPEGFVPEMPAAERQFFEENRRRIWAHFNELGTDKPGHVYKTDLFDHDILHTPFKRLRHSTHEGEREYGIESLFKLAATGFTCVDAKNSIYLLTLDGKGLTLSQAELIGGVLRRAFHDAVTMQPTLFGLEIHPHHALDNQQNAYDKGMLWGWAYTNAQVRKSAPALA